MLGFRSRVDRSDLLSNTDKSRSFNVCVTHTASIRAPRFICHWSSFLEHLIKLGWWVTHRPPLFLTGLRILVNLLLDTLPMLGNVLLLCFFVFFIFGIIGVQLWAGLLRNRCYLEENFTL